MTRTVRQTAANNAFLAHCKELFNAAVYRRMLGMVNGPEGPEAGEAAARAYLLTNVVTSLSF